VKKEKSASKGSEVPVEALGVVYKVRPARLGWCWVDATIEPNARAVQDAPLIWINREAAELRKAFAAAVAGLPAELVLRHKDFHHLGDEGEPRAIGVRGRPQ